MPLNDRDREFVSEIGRSFAQGASSVLRPQGGAGPRDVAGQALKITSRLVPKAAAATITVAGAGREIAVFAGGDARVTLELEGFDGQVSSLPALQGAVYTLPFKAARLVIPASAIDTDRILVLSSPVPGALRRDLEDIWIRFEAVSADGTGAGSALFNFDDIVDLEIDGILHVLECDATVATRTPVIALNLSDGLSRRAIFNGGATAASEQALTNLYPGGGFSAAETFAFGGVTFINSHENVPLMRLRGPIAPFVEATVTNGVAGDAHRIHVFGLLRGVVL